MRYSPRLLVYFATGSLWAGAVTFGAWGLWHYETASGVPAAPPNIWPAQSEVLRNPTLPTLVVLIHPHCPCSRATIEELARLMSDCNGKLRTAVLVLRPAGQAQGWERTDLWRSAAAIPGVSVTTDTEGRESRRFGAATSGQALLYAADGRLLFSGGITESRGHGGDNAGRSAICDLVLASSSASLPRPLNTPVYGCPLFDHCSVRPSQGVK